MTPVVCRKTSAATRWRSVPEEDIPFTKNRGLAAGGDLDITDDVRIVGAGAESTIIDAAAIDRVLHVSPGVHVELIGVTIRGGSALGVGQQGFGGGVLNFGMLTLTDSLFQANTASGSGGATSNDGQLTIGQSTLMGNTAGARGGAIANLLGSLSVINATISANAALSGGGLWNAGEATASHTTIADNEAAGSATESLGGGAANDSATGTFHIGNTIVAGNRAEAGDADVSDVFTSDGHNLIGVVGSDQGFSDGVDGDLVGTSATPLDPGLGPLAGWTIYLDLNDNQQLDSNEPRTVTAADDPNTTDVDETGHYEFIGLLPGVYLVREVPQDGFQQSSPGDRPLPDLLGESLDVVEPVARWGQQLTLGYAVRNVGLGESGPFDVEMVLSTDAIFDGADVVLTNFSLDSLLQDQSTSDSIVVTLPGAPGAPPDRFAEPDTAFVLMRIDPSGAVLESDEENNTGLGLGIDLATIGMREASDNAAPVLGDAVLFGLQRQDVTDEENDGVAVSLLVGEVTDSDAGASRGVAITAINETNGRVQFSTDGGDQWQDVAPLNQSTALLLSDAPANRLRFVPDLAFTGMIDDAVTFRAWDQTTGTEGARVDVTFNGEDSWPPTH